MRYGMGLVRSVLSWAMEAGRLPAQPVDPLAHILIGALDEARALRASARPTSEVGARRGAGARWTG